MFDARAVLGIVLYFKEKVLKPLRKDGYLNRCNLPKRKPSIRMVFFLERCVPCGNVMRTTCVMRPSDVMCASRVNWNTSHHCEQSEQHHNTARCSITCPPGQTSLYKADIFCFHIRPSSYNPEVVVVGVTFCNQQCEPI